MPANINYHLSPHPCYPSSGNVAKHPNHIGGVHLALSFLRERYSMRGEKSVLVGHGAGAYMVFQVDASCGATAALVVGVKGIYLGNFVTIFVQEYDDYKGLVERAFCRGLEGVDGEVLAETEGGVGKDSGMLFLMYGSQDELLSFWTVQVLGWGA